MTDQPTEILVAGTDQYPVVIGRGLRFGLSSHLGSAVNKVLVVHPPTLGAAAAELRESLTGQYEVLLAEVPDAEAAKRVEVASFLWGIMGQADLAARRAPDPGPDHRAGDGGRRGRGQDRDQHR